jgi:hypothetical protein
VAPDNLRAGVSKAPRYEEDGGLAILTPEQRRELVEIGEAAGFTGNLCTRQLPLAQRQAHIGDSTLADAIRDRLIDHAYKINLKGESLRKNKPI